MLIQPTLDGLKTLKLSGMLKALESQLAAPDSTALSFEERLGLLIDCEIASRDQRKTSTRMKLAKLTHVGSVEQFDVRGDRGITRAELAALATSDWARRKQNIILVGPTGVGKSFLAQALAQKACRDGFSVHTDRASRLFQKLAVARADGTYPNTIGTIASKDILMIDDFGLFALTAEQRQDFFELIDDRFSDRSTIITSQLPVEHWHEIIGEATVADAILDRVVHNSYKFQLKGDTRRKPESAEMKLVV